MKSTDCLFNQHPAPVKMSVVISVIVKNNPSRIKIVFNSDLITSCQAEGRLEE